MNRSSPRQFGLHVSERASTADASAHAGGASVKVLATLAILGLGLGVPGWIYSWPRSVNALRQTSRLVKSTAILEDMRVVEVPDPLLEGETIWRKEGLFRFQANAVDRQEWVTMGDFAKRSQVVPGGYGVRHSVWFDPETNTLTTYPPNEFHHWFLLMLNVVLSLAGFSCSLVLAQRVLQRWQARRTVVAGAGGAEPGGDSAP